MHSPHTPAVIFNATTEPIAIVGIGCRFPGGCHDVESFWKLLAEGRSGICEVPVDRWNRDRFYHPGGGVPGTMVTKWGGFVDNLDQFDASFWGVSPREAMRMDPQQRWLLEVAWEAIEDAGAVPQSLRGRSVGVFVGIAGNDYAGLQMPNVPQSDVHTISGCTLSIGANRISYMLDLRGPSLSIDTACSSSLVALWSACQSIRSGCCTSALVCGVNAIITPEATIGFSKATMLSPSGRCFAFDGRANGYVRGEGAGAIYVKLLAQAVADGDRIYAVIRSAVSNQDGHTSSMTVPSADGQAALLRQAYEQAGVTSASVVYMESHGTGTPVGDPIEATALGSVLSEGRSSDQPCLLGSVKTNIGHLEAGSGMAGVIKAALILYKDTIPPSLNYLTPNPHIAFAKLGLKVVTELQPLPHQNGSAPVIGVNSFGFGGANAHVVLEQAPQARFAPTPAILSRPYVLPISARNEVALRKYVDAYRVLLGKADVINDLAEICYSAGARKEHHEHRLAVVGRDAAQFRQRLGAWLREPGPIAGLVVGRPSATPAGLVFVYTGQGAQWYAMGRELLEREPIFTQTLVEIDALLQPLAGWSLLEQLTRDEAKSQIDRTDIAQPTLFALQVGLSELWKSWGIIPAKVVGHSVGEVAAAYVAGIYSLADAVKVIYERSRLQHTTGGNGRMLAVGISAAAALDAIGTNVDRVQIAVFNNPSLVTLSGDTEPLEEIAQRLEQSDKFVRWLRIDYAFHTHQMDPIKQELLAVLADIRGHAAQIPFVSTVTGKQIDGECIDANYWWNNVRQPVLFAPALVNMLSVEDVAFLEIGPHPALSTSIEECQREQGRHGGVFHSLRRGADDSQELLTNLADLHIHGLAVDWQTVNQSSRRHVELPQYPWCRESYWLESTQSQRSRLGPAQHPLLGVRIAAAKPTWQVELDLRRLVYLADHRFWDSSVFPATGFAEIGIAVARLLFPGEAYVVERLDIKKALFLSDDQPTTAQIIFDPETRSFSVYSSSGNEDSWELHVQGSLMLLAARTPEPFDPLLVRTRLPDHFDRDQHFDGLADAGYQFGPLFKLLRNVWRVQGEALAEVEVPDDFESAVGGYHIHPAVLDACLHVSFRLKVDVTKDDFYLPASIRRVHVERDYPSGAARTHGDPLWAHGILVADDGHSLTADIFIYDNHGQGVAQIIGLRLERVEKREADEIADDCFYQFHWEPLRLRARAIEGSCQFPTSSEMVSAARAPVPELYREKNGAEYFRRVAPRIDALADQAVFNAWLQLGWKAFVGERFASTEIFDRLGIVKEQRRLAAAQLHHFSKQCWLAGRGEDEWEVVRVFESVDITAAWDELAAEYPSFAAEIALHQLVSPHLSDVLSGEKEPIEVLFPGGSQDHLERFYVEGVDFPTATHLIRAAFNRLLEKLPTDRVLRVLEVGGGTGSLTRVLLPLLPADRTEYLFTDVGPAFLAAAKKQFADFPFVNYRRFDIEQEPQAQGIEVGGFDVIVGTLVLHATADLRYVVGNLRGCLADGGLLLFQELFPRRRAWDNIFGLLKGWWRFTDTDLRKHTPLLEREPWLALLEESGLRDVGSFGTSIDERESEQAFLFAFAPECKHVITGERITKIGGHYVVFADQGGVGEALSARLRERGHCVVQVRKGTEYRQQSDFEYEVAPTSETDYRRVLDHAGCPTDKLAGIVHCWSLDQAPMQDRESGRELTLEQLSSAQETGVLSALELIHAVSSGTPQRMFFVTRDSCRVNDVDQLQGLASAPMVGLLRVANNEFFPNKCVLIDFALAPTDGEGSADEVESLYYEVTDGDGEQEIAYRDNRRHVIRLTRVRLDQLKAQTRDAVQPIVAASMAADVEAMIPFRLQTSKPGILNNLSLNETQRRLPSDNEIEIRVRAGGINFRDMMKALGTYPGNPVDLLWFGDDVAGTVVRVGEAVQDFKPGDAVAGMVPYGFKAFVTVDSRLVFKPPQTISFEEAATIPTVFLTAHYALIHLARMQAGESILIHAGAGGVGQAAIQIAKHLGLEIFATAGSLEKRDLLCELGVAHVMNSRTLEFADEVLQITRGRGVDAVLNSLAGDFIPKSLSTLAPFGRFLEIGKIDIYKNTAIGLETFKNNISYFAIDLAQHLERKPEYAANLLREVSERVAAGNYKPLPRTVFPITQVADAFRFMAQGKHVGKNLLTFDVKPIPIGPCTESDYRLRSDATYLITGGAGGVGLELAKWFGQHGAKHIVLVSRSGPRDAATQRDIEQLREQGIAVVDARGDVARLADVTRIVNQISDTMPPLRGVIHAAMVLDDEFLISIDAARFQTAFNPKMAGAWNLHTATENLLLDHFVCMSSMSNVVGWPKQGNYNAGNNFLDAFSAYRRARGLPALTIDWGAILGAGFVQRNRKTAEFLPKVGSRALSLTEVIAIFSRLLMLDAIQIAAGHLDWSIAFKAYPNVGVSNTYTAVARKTADADRSGSLLAQVQRADADARAMLVEDFVAAQVAAVFGVTQEKIDRSTTLTSLGLDSLMALELANHLQREVTTSIPMKTLLGDANIQVVAQTLLRLLLETGVSKVDKTAKSTSPDRTDLPTSDDPYFQILSTATADLTLTDLRFDGAALAYLPDKFATVGGLTDRQLQAIFGTEPFISHYYEMALGRIAILMLPFRGHMLLRPETARQPILDAIEMAGRRGARYISLTGLIPSMTNYGKDIAGWLPGGPNCPGVTTGHATTTAAVVCNLEQMLKRVGRSLEQESLAVLGLGSIGQSCLKLLLEVCPHPREIILCDVFAMEQSWQVFAASLREQHAYHGRVRIASTITTVPTEIYEASTILTAVSAPDVLDVERLRPGTVIVDDSYPPAFSVEAAMHRLKMDADIFFSNAGMLRLPTPIRETMVVPPAAEALLQSFGVATYREELIRDPNELTACVLSSLLTGQPDGSFPPTIGLAGLPALVDHYQNLSRLHIESARPQCDKYFLPDEAVERFRLRFGGTLESGIDHVLSQ